jgi:hypothetical protein
VKPGGVGSGEVTAPAEGASQSEARRALLSKPVLAVLTMLALAVLAERLPFPRLRAFSLPPKASADKSARAAPEAPQAGEAQLTETTSGAALATPQRLSEAQPGARFGGQDAPLDWSKIETEPPPVGLVDRTGRALDGFFASLERTQRGLPGAITRIAHFGDSVIVSDYVSGTLRRKLQATFGDARRRAWLSAPRQRLARLLPQ